METTSQKMDVDFLCHHGTKGQKWGVRNYQYPDGSLTEKGRKHWGVGPPRDNSFRLETKEERAERLEKKRQRKEAYEAKKAARKAVREQKKAEKEELKAAKEERKRQEEAERITKMKIDLINKGDKEAIYKNRDKFTDDELKYAMQRIELQNKFNTKDKGNPYIDPSSKESKAEQKALLKAQKENQKKIALINQGDMDEIYKNRALFTDEELRYAKQRIELQNQFDKKGVGSNKIEVQGRRDAKKEAIAQRADPKEVYANRAMFTDDELNSLVKRIENTQKIKGMDPEAKKAAEDLKKAQDNKKTAKDGKSTVEKINEGMKTAVAVGGTLVAAYQTYAKIAAAYNEMNLNGKQLPTVDLNPWSRKDSDKKDKDKDDDKKDGNNQGSGKKNKQNNQGNQDGQQSNQGGGKKNNQSNQNSSKNTFQYDYDTDSMKDIGSYKVETKSSSPFNTYKTISGNNKAPGSINVAGTSIFNFKNQSDFFKSVTTSSDWKGASTPMEKAYIDMFDIYVNKGDAKLSDVSYNSIPIMSMGGPLSPHAKTYK